MKIKQGTKTALYWQWAIPAGKTDRIDERPLTSFPLNAEQFAKVRRAAEADGWHSFRCVKDDNSAPDFAAGVNRL